MAILSYQFFVELNKLTNVIATIYMSIINGARLPSFRVFAGFVTALIALIRENSIMAFPVSDPYFCVKSSMIEVFSPNSDNFCVL